MPRYLCATVTLGLISVAIPVRAADGPHAGHPPLLGMSISHCHLLNHEDKGLMEKVLFQ
ncbi:MAG TPA: hypothetical protein VFI45_14400 [Candidatus Acidoferrum sp.]|nr:hypothetical protein [Candidatus Acidoferrum sp.]